MSPYEATTVEVANELAGTPRRCEILQGWLDHRAALRGLGIVSGFQWLDGSFLEKKDPNDLDIVTFFRRPVAARTAQSIRDLFTATQVLRRAEIKTTYHLDAMFVDMDGTAEAIVDSTRYWLGLFSHRRVDHMWKGILKVDLSGNDDDAARRVVAAFRTAHGQAAGIP